MSCAYYINVPGTTESLETDTNGKVKVLPYPQYQFQGGMCLLEFRGNTIEACRHGKALETLIYRADGFEFDSFVRLLRRSYGKGQVSVRPNG